MKPEEFKKALVALARFLSTVGPAETAAQLQILSQVIDYENAKTTAARLKKLTAMPLEEPDQHRSDLLRLDHALKAHLELAKLTTSKTVFGLFQSFSDFVSKNKSHSAESLIQAVRQAPSAPSKKKSAAPIRPEIVRMYSSKLEECLGDDGFVNLHKRLAEDQSITTSEVVAIAKTFTGKKPPSRPKALQAIWSRHANLIGFRAKSESRSGRSAA